MGPLFILFTKVSRSLLAYGLFSWELQLGCETMYHTGLVTSFSCPLVLYITPVTPRRVFGRPQSAHRGIISSYVNMRNGCRFHLACMDRACSSLGMTNKSHIAQPLQMPLVAVVFMILNDNWGLEIRRPVQIPATQRHLNKPQE